MIEFSNRYDDFTNLVEIVIFEGDEVILIDHVGGIDHRSPASINAALEKAKERAAKHVVFYTKYGKDA